MLLAIDSEARYSGTNTNFSCILEPGITFKRIRLKFANICNPPDNTEIYYFVTIGNMQISARAPNMSGNSGTFIIPTVSGGGARNIFKSESDFTSVTEGEEIHLNILEVKIHIPGGLIAEDTGRNLLIFEFE
jgi:hypothetical protein